MSEKLKFGIIGCGRIANRHAEHISQKATLVSVCDIVKDRAEDFSDRFGATPFLNVKDMLYSSPDIEVVSICTPNGNHAEHAIQSLNAGKHVLCEKPMALSTYDCGEMIKAAERNNRRLFVVKQNRFNPPVAKLKQLIDGGKLGKIFSVQLNCFWNRNNDYYSNSWKGTRKLDGGTLFTQFSHFIDILYWLVGDVEKVCAFTDNFNHKGIIEFEDSGVVVLRFTNGAIGSINYTVNSFEKNMEGSVTVFGEKGTIKIGGQYLNELEFQSIENTNITDLPQGNAPNNYGTYVGSMSNHGEVYENLLDVLQRGASISTNMFEGLKTVEIIEKIYKSC